MRRMPLLAAMAIGAGIGALAGFAVYGAKVLFSKKRTWSWKDAGAHALGGLVGGGLFPPIMAGLAAVGVPAAGAYVLAGGISWGGIWSLAQDGASWALGRRSGLGPPKKYIVATAVGLAVSALLLPIAARTLSPAQHLQPHAGTADAFLAAPRGATNVLKAEGEFLAFGAMAEAGTALTEAGTALLRPALTRAGGAAVRMGGVDAANDYLPVHDSLPVESPPPPPALLEASSFGAWAGRLHPPIAEVFHDDLAEVFAQETGAVQALDGCFVE